MEPSVASEICVFPQICNAIRSPLGTATSGNNFNLNIDIFAKHAYTCGDNIVQECHFAARWVHKYNSLSWDIVDRQLSASDFPYPLEKIKWNSGVDKILENKDDLIQQILEFISTMQNVTPPFRDDDTVYVRLTFVSHVSVSPQEFELAQEKILAQHYESVAEILWEEIRDEINNRLRHGSSLYEQFQSLEGCVEKHVRKSIYWRMCLNENYERSLIESLNEQARKEFRSLPAVRSRIQFLQRVHLSQDKSTDECSICMGNCLAEQDTYSMPCNHSFHYGCIETWLLKNPSCPMCRYKLPLAESTYEAISFS